jgi:hypothetical protein
VTAIRVEITDQYGTATGILDPDKLPHLSPRQRDQLTALADGLVRDLAQILGSDEDHARRVAVSGLMRISADDAAYERVAERRGLLPL